MPLPAGARIEQVVPGGGCLILLGVDGAGRQFVALVDPFTGERISLLLMNSCPKSDTRARRGCAGRSAAASRSRW